MCPTPVFYSSRLKRLFDDKESDEEKRNEQKSVKSVLLFIIFCGVFCLLASETEGVVVDWSSLCMASLTACPSHCSPYLRDSFLLATAGCRLFCDRLRDNYGDKTIAAAGGVLSSLGGLFSCTYSFFSSSDSHWFCAVRRRALPYRAHSIQRRRKSPGVSRHCKAPTIALFNYGRNAFCPHRFSATTVQHTSLAMPFICSLSSLVLSLPSAAEYF